MACFPPWKVRISAYDSAHVCLRAVADCGFPRCAFLKTTPARAPYGLRRWFCRCCLSSAHGSVRAAPRSPLSAPDVCQAGEDVVCRLNVRHAPRFADAAGTLAISHLMTGETASLSFSAPQALTLTPLSGGAVTLTLQKAEIHDIFGLCRFPRSRRNRIHAGRSSPAF